MKYIALLVLVIFLMGTQAFRLKGPGMVLSEIMLAEEAKRQAQANQ